MKIDTLNSIIEGKEFSFGGGEGNGLQLDCGRSLPEVNISYETYGELDDSKSNAILVCHALTGNSHLAGRHSPDDSAVGWWNCMVGPGKPFDTDQYFIVCSNVIGGCMGSTGPRSINPDTGKPYRMDFPVITIADMTRGQKKLMEHLGIGKWLSVVGGSMGGMQALQWSVSYPESVGSVMAIATTSHLSPQAIAFDWVGRLAIMSDPAWNNGNYEDDLPESGLAIARMLGHITYLSDESMRRKFGRRLQEKENYSFDFSKDFQIESYLEHQGHQFVERFDANSYLYMTRAMDYFDLAPDGDLREAFAQSNSPFLVVSFSSDWLFPPENSREIVKALRNNNIEVSYCEMESAYGHDAFLLETETLGGLMADYLRARKADME